MRACVRARAGKPVVYELLVEGSNLLEVRYNAPIMRYNAACRLTMPHHVCDTFVLRCPIYVVVASAASRAVLLAQTRSGIVAAHTRPIARTLRRVAPRCARAAPAVRR